MAKQEKYKGTYDVEINPEFEMQGVQKDFEDLCNLIDVFDVFKANNRNPELFKKLDEFEELLNKEHERQTKLANQILKEYKRSIK
jgi:hypothetical protein